MGENGKITVGVLSLCGAGILAAVGFSAFAKVQTASFIGMVAGGLCLLGMYFAFASWKEKPAAKAEGADNGEADAPVVVAEADAMPLQAIKPETEPVKAEDGE